MGRDDDWVWEPEEFGRAHRGKRAELHLMQHAADRHSGRFGWW